MSLTRKVALNTMIQILGKGITAAISIFLIAALTRYLGVAGYGQYTTIFAYIAFAGVLADFGFFWIMARELGAGKEREEKIVGNVLTMRALLASLVYLASFLIALLIPQYDSTVKFGIGLTGLAMFWLLLNSTLIGVFQAKLRMDKAIVSDIVGRLIILGIILYGINQQWPLLNLISAYLIGNLVNFVLSFIFAQKYIRIRPQFEWGYWKYLIRETLPMGIVLTLGIIYFKIDAIMLSLMKNKIDMGIYGAPWKVLETLSLIPAMFMGTMVPIITRIIKEKVNQEKINYVFQNSLDFLIIIGTLVVFAVLTLAWPIINILAGEEFLSASTVSIGGLKAGAPLALQILIIAVGISFISHLFNYSVIALGKQKLLISRNVAAILVNVILNLILIPFYSYIAAAFTTVVTEIVMLILAMKIVYKYLPLDLHWGVLLKSLVAGAVMSATLILLSQWHILILIPLGGLVYFGVLYLLGGIKKELIVEMIKR